MELIQFHPATPTRTKTEKADGSVPDATKMADAIITSQTAEISRMNSLLGKS